MAYYKYRAYDKTAKLINGVDEADRYELVALKLIRAGLTPAMIEVIEYGEYKVLLQATKRIYKLEKIKAKLKGNDEQINSQENHPHLILISVAIILILGLCCYLTLSHLHLLG